MKLTGRTRHRSGWLGGLILQVEVSEKMGDIHGESWTRRRWIDAKAEHMVEMEARNDID